MKRFYRVREYDGLFTAEGEPRCTEKVLEGKNFLGIEDIQFKRPTKTKFVEKIKKFEQWEGNPVSQLYLEAFVTGPPGKLHTTLWLSPSGTRNSEA